MKIEQKPYNYKAGLLLILAFFIASSTTNPQSGGQHDGGSTPDGSSVSSKAETLSHVLGLVEAFRSFDSDNDGLITMEELGGIIGSHGYNVTDQEARSIIQQNEKNKDGLLTLTEFLEFNTKDMDLGNLATFLRVAVQDLDMDANDFVTGAELCEVIEENEMVLPMAVCQQIIGSMDRDGDGTVSLEDFRLIVNALL